MPSLPGGRERLLISVAVLFTVLTACNHEPIVTEIDFERTGGGKLYLLTQPEGGSTDAADLVGVLQLNDGCFQIASDRLDGAQSINIIWAEGYRVAIDGEDVLILDANRRVVTRVGARTLVGGSGGPDDSKRIGGCAGGFWCASPGVRSGDAIPAAFD